MLSGESSRMRASRASSSFEAAAAMIARSSAGAISSAVRRQSSAKSAAGPFSFARKAIDVGPSSARLGGRSARSSVGTKRPEPSSPMSSITRYDASLFSRQHHAVHQNHLR